MRSLCIVYAYAQCVARTPACEQTVTGAIMKRNVWVRVCGREFEVLIERLPGTQSYRVLGGVKGTPVQIERHHGYNGALAAWRTAAAKELKTSVACTADLLQGGSGAGLGMRINRADSNSSVNDPLNPVQQLRAF